MTGTPSPSRRVPSEPGDFPETGPYSLPPLTHRLAARLIDLVIVTLPVVAIAIGFVEVDGGEVRIEDVPWWLLGVQVGVAVVYETVLIAWWGTTVGKWALGMRVVRYADGKRPDVTRASQRSLLPNMFAAVPIAFVSLLQWVVYGSSATHPLRRGWHDRYAGTLVVRSR